ncbi:MAG: DUF429 domain-containing protein [Spirochaetaceae bacterium]|nr:DUF429 domain-containing protein [Spirochaetaceae bacterium]
MEKYVLGIDSAWSIKNPSGIALLRIDSGNTPTFVKAGRSYDEFLRGKINWNGRPGMSVDFERLLSSLDRQIDVVALDIPLSPTLISGRREADQAISKAFGGRKASTHTPTKDRPGQLGLTIFNQLEKFGFTWACRWIPPRAFIEVYPHTAIIEAFGYKERFPYKVSKKRQYWPDAAPAQRNRNMIHNLNELRDRLSEAIQGMEDFHRLQPTQDYPEWYLKGYEDLLDGLVCALTGYHYLTKDIKPYGDETGVIWVPILNGENADD